jgi:DNA-binding NtrC family response regulator
VRELENVIHRALIVTAGSTLLPESITFADDREGASPAELGGAELLDLLFARLRDRFEETGETVLDVLEKEMLKRALDHLEGNQVQAARILGMSRQTLRKRLEEAGEE